MLRRIFMALPALGLLLSTGCARPSQLFVTDDARLYACRLNDAPAPSGAELHISVRPDDRRAGLQFIIGGQKRALTVVAGSSGQTYADTTYAWRDVGATGVLTDIENVQTYECTADGTTRGPVK
jgi:membrane-bound inhibitor of C-type lysozyme